jgi:hypothetical protein
VSGTAGPKRQEVTGRWRKLHNDELCNSYSSQNIIMKHKSKRMLWAGREKHMKKPAQRWGIILR